MRYYPRWPVYLAWCLIAGFLALIFGCPRAYSLTPRERTIVLHAQSELEAAIAHGVAIDAELVQAQLHSKAAGSAAIAASASVAVAASKAKEAESKAKEQHDELKRCASENADMRVLVKKVTGPWWFPGGNALLYGLGKSLISLAVIITVLIIIGVLIKVFVPAAEPAIAFAGGIGRKILLLFKRKPMP